MKTIKQLNQLKQSIMQHLEKCVDDMLDHLQANEIEQHGDYSDNDFGGSPPNLVPGYFDGGLSIHFPPNQGSNGKSGWHMSYQPSLMLQPEAYPDHESLLKVTSRLTYKKG